MKTYMIGLLLIVIAAPFAALADEPADAEVVVTSFQKASELRVDTSIYKGNGEGEQLAVLYRSRFSEKWELLGRVDAIGRFDETDVKTSAGVIYHMEKRNLRVELSHSAQNTLFPRDTIESEFVSPITSNLVGYASLRYSDYRQVALKNYLASLAAEYYATGKDMIYVRLFYSIDDFKSVQDQRSMSGMIKYVRFITDDNRIWIYYANSAESVIHAYNETVGQLKGKTVGVGASRKINKDYSVEINAERRKRDDLNTVDYIFSVSIVRKF